MEQTGEQCILCTDAETFENPVLNCIGCNLKVHVLCYGVESLEPIWKCSPCQSNKLQPVCKLCMQDGGALKKTTCDGWVHVLCGLFTEGCHFMDVNQMEPVDITRISNSKRNKKCSFCEKDTGFSPLCARSKCKNRLHISCAQKSDCLKEEKDKYDKLKFRAYCLEHKPASTSRRISSQFLRVVVLKKNKEKKAEEKSEKEHSSISNSQWLINKTTSAIEPSTIEKSSMKRKQSVNVDESVAPKLAKTLDEPSLLDWDSPKLKSLTPSMENIFANKDNFHTCYKDKRITKLKSKNKKLKEKLGKLEDLNANLQQQLLCAKQFLQMPSSRTDVSNQDILQALKNRIVPQLSEDESEYVYPNGVRVLVKLMQQLETTPGIASSDRAHVNNAFVLFFGDKFMKKKIKKCKKNGVELSKLRETVLKILRESNNYQIMKDLYEYRVYMNGIGDLVARVRLFKLIFRTKFNNWWNANALKSI